MKSIFKNQKGIALLIVLSTLMVLTTSVVEFAYNSRVNYRLAVHAKERLQAYYLAKSGLNFSRLILKYNKEAEALLESAGTAASGMGMEPLYRILPLSSELLRGVLGGDTSGLMPAESAADKENPEEGKPEEETSAEEETAEDEEEKIKSGVSMISREEAEKFLSFEGDFSSEITEEQTHYDLNKIAALLSTSPAYDQRKRFLYSILMNPKFENFFKNQEQDAADLVHALSDWVDSNGVIDEFENIQRGDEDSIYTDADYPVKNGKMLSVQEMRLVSGMTDDIYQALEPFVTVTGGDEKINICVGENEDMVKALIYHYTHHAGCAQPVDYADDEKMTELADAVTGACPDTSAMATALHTALGLVDLEEESTAEAGGGGGGGETVSGCSFQFKDLLTKDNKIFNIRATGVVGETEVNIVSILNTGSANPNQWKVLYFRVE